MSRRSWTWAFAGVALLGAWPAAAQVTPAIPGPGMGGPPVASVAEFLLANTGELHLSDQQVTRLAGIARRAESQRQALRATMDSVMAAPRARPDSARPRAGVMRGPGAPPAAFLRMRDQTHADLRDALAVLNPDQLATAWELASRRTMLFGVQARAAGIRRLPPPGTIRRGFRVQPPAVPQPPSPPQPPVNPPQPPS